MNAPKVPADVRLYVLDTGLIQCATYAAPDQAKIQKITGRHDVFGDGTVVTVPLPGHAPGHQGLLVALPCEPSTSTSTPSGRSRPRPGTTPDRSQVSGLRTDRGSVRNQEATAIRPG